MPYEIHRVYPDGRRAVISSFSSKDLAEVSFAGYERMAARMDTCPVYELVPVKRRYHIRVERQIYEERELEVEAVDDSDAIARAWAELSNVDPDDLPRNEQIVHAINLEVETN